jgi:hypothetical protein
VPASKLLLENAKRDLLSDLPKDTALSFTYQGIAAVLRFILADRKLNTGRMTSPTAATVRKDVELLATILEHTEGGVEEAVHKITGEVTEAVKSLEELKESTIEATNTYRTTIEAELKEDLGLFMKDFTEEGLNQRKAMEEILLRQGNAGGMSEGREGLTVLQQADIGHSYAQAVQNLARPAHQASIMRNERTERQFVIRKSTEMGLNLDSLDQLDEFQLRAKANRALDDQTFLDRGNAKFVAARRIMGGAILLEVDSDESATWLRRPEIMKVFNEKFGVARVAANVFQVVGEFVPLSADVMDPQVHREVERANGLPLNCIQEGRWLKPPHKRSRGQTYGHAQFGISMAKSANMIIRDGITIRGRRIRGRKPTHTPRQCVKCYQFKPHIARECNHPHDVCGLCAEHHKTADCVINDRASRKCSNCAASGHGAVDNECPVYQQKLAAMRERNPDMAYPYYTTEEPWTWVKEGGENVTSALGLLPMAAQIIQQGGRQQNMQTEATGSNREPVGDGWQRVGRTRSRFRGAQPESNPPPRQTSPMRQGILDFRTAGSYQRSQQRRVNAPMGDERQRSQSRQPPSQPRAMAHSQAGESDRLSYVGTPQ